MERLSDPAFNRITQLEGPRRTKARVTPRLGTGINPSCFSTGSTPVLGAEVTFDVNTSVHPAPTLAIVDGRAVALEPGLLLGVGELLIDLGAGPPILLEGIAASGGVDSISVAVPNDIALVGFRFVAQAGVLGGGQTVLCNALDLVLGGA